MQPPFFPFIKAAASFIGWKVATLRKFKLSFDLEVRIIMLLSTCLFHKKYHAEIPGGTKHISPQIWLYLLKATSMKDSNHKVQSETKMLFKSILELAAPCNSVDEKGKRVD